MVNTVLGPMVYLYANNYAQEFVPVHFLTILLMRENRSQCTFLRSICSDRFLLFHL